MIKFARLPLFLLILLVSSGPLRGQDVPGDVLETITFKAQNSGEEAILFKLNGVCAPKVFSIKGKNPRVVFDFFGTRSSDLVEHMITAGGDLVRRIRVGVHYKPKPKTRVVIDLVPGREVTVEKDFDETTNILQVTIARAGRKDVEKPVKKPEKKPIITPKQPEPTPEVLARKEEKKEPKLAPPVVVKEQRQAKSEKTSVGKTSVEKSNVLPPPVQKGTSSPYLSEVTFENTSNKGEMVLFKLNDFYPPIVFGIEKGDPRVVCDFLGTTLGPDVKEVINSNGKYVKRIRLAKHQHPDKIRVVLDLVPNSNYDLQQVFFKEDNLFVIIIDPFLASGGK